MRIGLAGGLKVTAEFQGFTMWTDQPVAVGGDGSAPAPFDLFLASIGTCAGFFVARFCQGRGIDTAGIALELTAQHDEQSHLVTHIRLAIRLPASFPARCQPAVVRAAELCTVKQHLRAPPATAT
ncbi:MAG: OsmC family protein [Actinobacteria bacterium]|nr:OsmC family protein [Actinomycetota bacterium]